MNKTEEENEVGIGTQLVILIFIAVVIGGIGYMTYDMLYSPTDKMHEFCKSENYNEATSFKNYAMSDKQYRYKIICDDDKVFKVAYSSGCDKYDKYEDCIWKSTDFIKYNDAVVSGDEQ